MLPDYPNRPNPRAVWFTKEHAEIALHRLTRHGRAEPKSVTWAGARYEMSGQRARFNDTDTCVDAHIPPISLTV